MDFVFDRQNFYKMNSEEMMDALCDACDKLKLLYIKREDLERFVFEFQLGKRGVNPYDYLVVINKRREKEFLKRIFDKELMFQELLRKEKKTWLKYFQTNKVDAKMYQDFFLQQIDNVVSRCKEMGIEPSYDYERLKQEYFAFKREYFKTHTIKENREV